MTTPAEFTALAGAAVVGSMGTEAWQYAKARCIELFQRHAPERSAAVLERLDDHERVIVAATESVRKTVAPVITQEVTNELAAVAARSSDAAQAVLALHSLLEEPAAGNAQYISTVTDVDTGGGDFLFGGRDINVNKGDK